MKTLLVTATTLEVAPALRELFPGIGVSPGPGVPGTLIESGELDCLVTGVGQLQCAARLAKLLAERRYGAAIQAGIAGSFTDSLPKRSVVVVAEEALADLGAESQEGFLDLFEMGLLAPDDHPFSAGRLVAPQLNLPSMEGLPRAKSVTVNRVLSQRESIDWVVQRFQPQVVNMEGGAFFLCCGQAGLPCLSVRSISDRVGPRDKSSWDIPGAIAALNEVLLRSIPELQAWASASSKKFVHLTTLPPPTRH
jgi:futalosine hydrolase